MSRAAGRREPRPDARLADAPSAADESAADTAAPARAPQRHAAPAAAGHAPGRRPAAASAGEPVATTTMTVHRRCPGRLPISGHRRCRQPGNPGFPAAGCRSRTRTALGPAPDRAAAGERRNPGHDRRRGRERARRRSPSSPKDSTPRGGPPRSTAASWVITNAGVLPSTPTSRGRTAAFSTRPRSRPQGR